MKTNLWSANTPALFWQCDGEIDQADWEEGARRAAELCLPFNYQDCDGLLADTLGEAQFGSKHWELSIAKKGYYLIKGFIPSRLRRWLRQLLTSKTHPDGQLNWPVEDRYVKFQMETIRQLLLITGRDSIQFTNFWPFPSEFALVLTHDIETGYGQSFIQAVADLEESLGFRSSFNFCADEYPIDLHIVQNLTKRGFEVGLHGLKHDQKLFSSYEFFMENTQRINTSLKNLGAVGFRSPSTHRQPEWMQALEMEYDLSFFDTDPWEPIPGGSMSIWPFAIGKFIELPYTLVQDNTLVNVLKQKTPQIWLEKVEFIQRYHGMVLINTHPDYLRDKTVWNVYADFLKELLEIGNYWHALPREVSRWWLLRSTRNYSDALLKPWTREVKLHQGELMIC
jgi:hypothetical protein